MLSIIIPTFGNFARVAKLLRSMQKYENTKRTDYELILVNDKPGISQQSIEQAGARAIVINNEKNLGFSGSINRGLKEAKGDILLLVNDDIVWTSPVLDKVKKEFEDPELGVLGALLYYPKGARDRAPSIQHAGMTFDPKLKSFYHIKQNPKTKYMLAVTGAFFGISRKLYETIGGLDESFFLACEDTKYCIEAWNHDFKVKFSAGISATHEEGATRGKNPQEKRKYKDWTSKEAIGITRFKASLDLHHIQAIQKSIRKLNNEHLKIEVGSGYNPHPGFKHLDIRAGLPELDYVCDFIKDALPFEDGSVEEILANHVIEHIPFRKLPFVLKEWARVLEDGGKLSLRTPNLKFICETYLAGNLTPEWPGDEKFITDNLSPTMTPSWWANIKLFSGQDYAANFHHVCFDFEMLSQLLKRYGFGVVKQVKFDREFSPGELQVEAVKGLTVELLENIYKQMIAHPASLTNIPGTDTWVHLKENEEKTFQKELKNALVEMHGFADPFLEKEAKVYSQEELTSTKEIKEKWAAGFTYNFKESEKKLIDDAHSDLVRQEGPERSFKGWGFPPEKAEELERKSGPKKDLITEPQLSNTRWMGKEEALETFGETGPEWKTPAYSMKDVAPKSCLVIRNGAMGDVILTTPIIERLAKTFTHIDVSTKVSEIFTHNKNVRQTLHLSQTAIENLGNNYDKIIDLNNAYELRPNMHIVDAYSEVAFEDQETPLKTNLYHPSVNKQDWIVVHAAKSWENRTWNCGYWYNVITHLVAHKEKVVIIGAGDDYVVDNTAGVTNLVGKQSFWDMVYTISAAKLFIGMDSGPLHVAEAVKTPALGIYTCAKAIYRSTSPLTHHILPKIDCYGCLHDEKPPVHYCGCRRKDFKCLELITPEKVIEAYEQFIDREATCGDLKQQSSDCP